MIAEILVVLTLLATAFEDFKSRAVHVYWFMVLFVGLIYIALANQSIAEVFNKLSLNVIFCLIQFALLNFYFCLKERKWLWIFDRYLGWGDVVFLLCITAVWGLLGFIFYIVSSLIVSLLIYVFIIRFKSKRIPLAGLQALCLIFFLMLEWNGIFNLDYEIYIFLNI